MPRKKTRVIHVPNILKEYYSFVSNIEIIEHVLSKEVDRIVKIKYDTYMNEAASSEELDPVSASLQKESTVTEED